MYTGERPMGAAKGKQTNNMTSCQPLPPACSPCKRAFFPQDKGSVLNCYCLMPFSRHHIHHL